MWYNLNGEMLMKQIIDLIQEKLSPNAKVKNKLNTTNNDVYIIQNDGKEYILKLYKSKNWPENGKNIFVNSLLEKKKINFAKVIDYSRDCDFSKGGYILEEKITGNPVDLNNLSLTDGKLLYKHLAKFIKKVHSITFKKYGWINNGYPYFNTFCDFLLYDIKEHSESLIKEKILTKSVFEKVCNHLKKSFSELNITPCLCHGDLSLRNAIWDGKQLTLIDYDDAMALPNYADIARLTFDMRGYSNFEEFRKAFLDTYFKSSQEQKSFEEFEKLYHLYCCIDWIDFDINKGYDYKNLLKYFKELLANIAKR